MELYARVYVSSDVPANAGQIDSVFLTVLKMQANRFDLQIRS